MKTKRKVQQIPLVFRPLLWDFKNGISSKRKMWISIMASGCGLIFFTLMLIGSLHSYLSPLVKKGVETEAVVVWVESAVRYGGNACDSSNITYTFDIITSQVQETFEGTDRVSDCLFPVSIGETITITYASTNPLINMVGEPVNRIEDAPFVLSCFGLMLLGSLYSFIGNIFLKRVAENEKLKNST